MGHRDQTVEEFSEVRKCSRSELMSSLCRTRINIGDSIETNRIGGAVYPTLALVNHSCDPNFVIIFWGRTAIAVASRTIFKGEEMNDNYGANYANTGLQTRRKNMEKSHWFTCACRFFLIADLIQKNNI